MFNASINEILKYLLLFGIMLELYFHCDFLLGNNPPEIIEPSRKHFLSEIA